MQIPSELSAAQLRGLLSAPDAGSSVLPSGVERFTTHDLLTIPETHPVPDLLPHTVFGKRMEQLLKSAIDASDRYDVIADNIQIIENGATIGELDFILHDLAQDKLIHLELAVKFYVYDPSLPPGLQRWTGPNRRDSLVRKIDKLKNRQFPLLYRPEAQNTLRNLNLPDLPIAQALCFKTMLFPPAHQPGYTPDSLNPKAEWGSWIRFDDFHHLRDHSFYLPEKPEWICDPSSNEIWNDFEKTLPELEVLISRQRSPLCWMKSPKDDFESIFVVWW